MPILAWIPGIIPHPALMHAILALGAWDYPLYQALYMATLDLSAGDYPLHPA